MNDDNESRRFVSALHIPRVDPSSLISGGGDPVVKVWDWMSGRLRWELRVMESVEPFIRVERVGKKREAIEGKSDGEGSENSQQKRGRKQKKKGNKKKNLEEDEIANENRDEDGVPGTPQPQKVLVIQHIESISTTQSGTFILFSAVGLVSRRFSSLNILTSLPFPSFKWGD